jgi:mannan endo-1,4-beta-mannosidase
MGSHIDMAALCFAIRHSSHRLPRARPVKLNPGGKAIAHHDAGENRTLAIASPFSNSPTHHVSPNPFPRVSGLDFEIDGKTQYYAGTNSYWLPFLTNNSDVDHVMGDLQKSGLKVLRVWGFNDVNTVPSAGTVWFQLLQNGTATINTGPDGLQRLDYVVKSAEAHDVKLIINFVNNWNDYGGMAAYNNAFGGNATTWYTIPEIQNTYQAYIKAVVGRYEHSPAIFSWELANEPRCHGCPTSVVTNWVASTSKYVKSLDSKHLVCIGDGMARSTPFIVFISVK